MILVTIANGRLAALLRVYIPIDPSFAERDGQPTEAWIQHLMTSRF